MKKIFLTILATLVIGALVSGALGVRYSRRLLAMKPPSAASPALPTFAWIDPADEKDSGPLFFDLHRVGNYPVNIGSPTFSTTSGWSVRESSGTWAIGEESILDFRLDSTQDRTLILNTNPTGDLFDRPQIAEVTLNGATLGSVKISDSKPLSTIRIPADLQSEGLNRLVFKFDFTVKPLDRWGGNDTRPLAAWFRNITILNGSFGEVSASLKVIKMFRQLKRDWKRTPASISHRDRLIVRKEGSVVAAIDPNMQTDLHIEIRPRISTESISMIAHDLTGQSAPATLMGPKAEKGAVNGTVQLPEMFDTAFLEIKFENVDRERPIRITAPWLNTMPPPPRFPSEPVDSGQIVPANLVVLILDAARADRVGCYGSDRPTTPHIDALAAESLVFPDVVALAPYTLCSVPTMATGLSFLEHGVVARGQSLAAAPTTLAEVLQEAGYTTAAFSATPNNSKKLGVTQGYEIFEEAWRGVRRAPALDPHRLVGMAETWLAEQPTNRPYHLMIHMVPPHEPYEPGPEFDHFSDQTYQGPADGSRSFIDLFNSNPSHLTPADLEQTKSLYDGNLLKADDAVGQFLNTLRKRSDWDRTAVLITSDHGEALGEHERIGHNAHVYEEMIRVPLILKLPKAVDQPAKKVTAQSATLADMAPTLAALAGRSFPDSITGRDLLSEAHLRARASVIRTAHEKPTFGLRTPRWKLVVQNANELDLFDLSTDPEESKNLTRSEMVIAGGLRQILLARLAAEPLFAPADEASLTEQDEAMLRTLGYIE